MKSGTTGIVELSIKMRLECDATENEVKEAIEKIYEYDKIKKIFAAYLFVEDLQIEDKTTYNY
jgi:hypothetical protein